MDLPASKTTRPFLGHLNGFYALLVGFRRAWSVLEQQNIVQRLNFASKTLNIFFALLPIWWLTVWRSGIPLVSINEVNLR